MPEPGPEAALFDKPQATQRIEGETLDAAHSFECTWYADLMLRETNTNGPAFGHSYIVPRQPGGARPACPGVLNPHDVEVPTVEQTFVGRKGAFLFYEATDANGPEPFAIRRLPDGKGICDDVMAASAGLQAMSVDGGVLRLSYLRAYYAPCSLPKDGAACWAKAIKAGHFARAIAARPAPVEACAEPYRAAQAPATDPSVITYPVEMTLTQEGKATILSRGALGCAPGP